MGKKIKIALVAVSDGLEYDDRIRKEILSVKKLYPDIDFKAFVMLPDNKEFEGTTSYGTTYKSVYIQARDKYKSSQKLILKAWQFHRAIKEEIKEYDAIWAVNDTVPFTLLLSHNKRILWDEHELPTSYLSSKLKRVFLQLLYAKCKVVIHANIQREKYIEKLGLIKDPQKHFALRNYPNFTDIDTEYDDMYHHFKTWKADRQCVYLQGLDGERRAAYESIKAVLRDPRLIAVVVGGFNKSIKRTLYEEYGEELDRRIMFVGMIPQLKIPQYVQECYTSLVFYKNVSPNNYYCEANRFYQAVIMGLPVVVGCNPSMRDVVEQYGFGVSIDDDGSDIEAIQEGLNKVINNYEMYRANIKKNRGKIVWDNQDPIICNIIDKLFEQ